MNSLTWVPKLYLDRPKWFISSKRFLMPRLLTVIFSLQIVRRKWRSNWDQSNIKYACSYVCHCCCLQLLLSCQLHRHLSTWRLWWKIFKLGYGAIKIVSWLGNSYLTEIAAMVVTSFFLWAYGSKKREVHNKLTKNKKIWYIIKEQETKYPTDWEHKTCRENLHDNSPLWDPN